MKKLINLVLIIFSTLTLCAQVKIVDSLEFLLANKKTDTGKINLLELIGRKIGYDPKQKDSSNWYLQKALEFSKKINYSQGEFKAQLYIAENLYYAGNLAQALIVSLRNLKKEELYKDTSAIFMEYRLTSWIYSDVGDDKSALEYACKMRSIVQAGFYKQDSEKLYNALSNGTIGNIYSDLNKPDSALYFDLLVYRYASQYKDLQFLTLTPYWIGNIYALIRKDDSAFYFYRISIQNAANTYRPELVPAAELGIANVFYNEKRLDSAFYYARHSMKSDYDAGDSISVIYVYQLLAKLFYSSRRFDSAYIYQQKFTTLNDSLINRKKISEAQNMMFNETLHDQQIDAAKKEAEQEYQSKIKIYVLAAVIIVILVITFLLVRNVRNKKKANEQLQIQKEEIEQQKKNVEKALSELKSTQTQLVQSEKMASLGELTAGIAHEIQNPLNFVNNFSDVNQELLAEMKDEMDKGNIEEVKAIANDVIENEEKINHHGKRADAIVKGMLQHSRSSTGQKELTDINALADEYLRLSYHGLRAKEKSFNATMKTDLDETIGKINIVPQDIGRVLLNLYNNAFYAVNERHKAEGVDYEPIVSVVTKRSLSFGEGRGEVSITVSDNGNGIPQKVVDKIFQPFFTTKPTGQGTGLGLSLSYDIIKAHGGEIKVKTKEGEGSEFIIELPLS